MNRKTTQLSAIFATCLLGTAFLAQPGQAGEPSPPPQMAAVAEAPTPQLASQGCFDVSDDAAELTVRECLTASRVGQPSPVAAPSVPEAMLRELGAELQWLPQLMPRLNEPGQLVGEYTRRATLRGLETHDMGTHEIDLLVEISGEIITFTLRLGGHQVHVVDGQVDGDGDGHLTFSYGNTAPQRTVVFEGGQRALDRAPTPSDKSSSFYMGCYVDTPAYDTFTPNYCLRLFGSQPTTAVFKVFLPYTPQSVVWLTPSSSCSGLWCTAPISPNQTVYGYAYWVINGIPTGPVSATAVYDSGL